MISNLMVSISKVLQIFGNTVPQVGSLYYVVDDLSILFEEYLQCMV